MVVAPTVIHLMVSPHPPTSRVHRAVATCNSISEIPTVATCNSISEIPISAWPTPINRSWPIGAKKHQPSSTPILPQPSSTIIKHQLSSLIIPSLLYFGHHPTNPLESSPSYHKASKAINLDEMIIVVVTVLPPVTGVAPSSPSSKHAVGRSAGPFTWLVFLGGWHDQKILRKNLCGNL